MTFPILGGNGAVAGYSIDNSLRFNDNDSPYLSRTTGTATNTRIFTYSVWVKRGNLGDINLFNGDDGSDGNNNFDAFYFRADHKIFLYGYAGGDRISIVTNRVFRDTSAWYHLVLACDTTQSTASNRIKLYVNGVQETSFSPETQPSQNLETYFNGNSIRQQIGRYPDSNVLHYDGYMAEINFVDGQQLTPTSFGEFDEDSGIWKPIEYTGTFGNNGFYLDFENSGSLGTDQSANGNNFTPTNLASTDQTTDTPTNNFSTLNANDNTGTLSEGNLKDAISTSNARSVTSTIGVSSGKWYCEVVPTALSGGGSGNNLFVGVVDDTFSAENSSSTYPFNHTTSVGYFAENGQKKINGTFTTYGATYTVGDIIGVAFNLDDDEITFYKNGTTQGTISHTFPSSQYRFYLSHGSSTGSSTAVINFGQEGSFAGNKTAQGNADGNGYGDFYYTPPSGFLAPCTQNLATALSPTIDDGSAYFQSTPYTGNGSDGYAVTNSGYSDLQPDFVWIKKRNSTSQHVLTDSIRGVTKQLFSSTNQVEQTSTEFLASFDSDGFTTNNNSTGTDTGDTNIANGDTYVGWQWKASGGTTSSNTSGSITSTVQANTTAGFSIVTFTGNATAGATVGHGLGVKPEIIFSKNRSNGNNWNCYVEAVDNTGDYTLTLNGTGAKSNSFNMWNDTAPTSSVITLGNRGETNGSGHNMVHYVWHSVEGYSKMGSYTGNGNSDGTFVYTGFRPAFVIYKNSSSATDWRMFDNKRNAFNVIDGRLFPNTNGAENTAQDTVDFLSNGFKLRATNSGDNGSGNTFIYMCFAENPFVSSSGVPVVAR